MQIPRLHPDTIEQVKQRADIVDVISEHVVLRKSGKDYVGLCPFHEEKSPSFTVVPTKQMYHCFGCKASGNALKFLMELGKRSFPEVVLDLARRYQVPVQTLEPEQRQEFQRQLSQRELLYEILAVAASFYQHALRQEQGEMALEYLKEARRLNEETIQKFQLGYAPAGWEILCNYLVDTKHYSIQLIEKAGLIVPRKSGSGYYDRFRHRLMIPIHDVQGRIIGFGSRTLINEEQPKYLNSPETDLFDKSKTLFALDKARDAISQQEFAVVVEGYFDAIALHASGINNVVASLGTAFSLDQVRQLLRYSESKQIILNFDADTAGTKAAERAIGELGSLAYSGQVQLRILNLPDGKDADEFLHTPGNSEKYRQLLATAPLWIDWQIQQILVGKDVNQADNYQQVAGAMVKVLSNITNDNLFTHYIPYCAELLSQGNSAQRSLITENLQNQVITNWQQRLKQDDSLKVPLLIRNLLQRKNKQLQLHRPQNQRSHKGIKVNTQLYRLEKAEALLLLIYLHYPKYRGEIYATLETQYLVDFKLDFSMSHHRFLWRQILEIELQKQTIPDDLISLLQDRSIQFPTEMTQVAHLFHLDEKMLKEILRPSLVIQASVATMERVMWEKLRRKYLQEYAKLDLKLAPESSKQLWQQAFHNADNRIKELDYERLFALVDVIQLPFN